MFVLAMHFGAQLTLKYTVYRRLVTYFIVFVEQFLCSQNSQSYECLRPILYMQISVKNQMNCHETNLRMLSLLRPDAQVKLELIVDIWFDNGLAPSVNIPLMSKRTRRNIYRSICYVLHISYLYFTNFYEFEKPS